MNPSSIQELIKCSLSKKSRVFFHIKRGYRTKTFAGYDLYNKISAFRNILKKKRIKNALNYMIL